MTDQKGNKKLWGGRFTGSVAPLTEQFGASISFDQKLYAEDITGSIAHAKGLAKQGIITAEDTQLIIAGLNQILSEIMDGTIEFSTSDEDIHMNIERLLTEKIGEAGKKLHTGRSRNDQIALDMRLYTRRITRETLTNLKDLIKTLLVLAEKHLEDPMPAYTHMQKAQPITLAHYFMSYTEMFLRDVERFYDSLKRIEVMPLGSGALAGTTYPLDREFVAEKLGFHRITGNSLDGVSDRDFILEYLSNSAISMMHLSRFSEEIVLYSTAEFGYLTLSDAYSTGSSMMPQKKNADFAELIRGRTGRIYGHLMAFLTTMKGLPLAYNKDLQEDKEGLFDTAEILNTALQVFAGMIATSEYKTTKLFKSANSGFMNATDSADYLVSKGLSFRDAYLTIGKIVAYAEPLELKLQDIGLEKLQTFSPLFEEDFYSTISLKNAIARRNLPGGPAKSAVTKHIQTVKERLDTFTL